MATKSTKPKPKAVLVTTEFRGVFFGYVKNDKKFPAEITLTGVRNCIYWTGTGGFLGLASVGPNKQCRIGARASEVVIPKITSMTPVDDAAVTAWESAVIYGA